MFRKFLIESSKKLLALKIQPTRSLHLYRKPLLSLRNLSGKTQYAQKQSFRARRDEIFVAESKSFLDKLNRLTIKRRIQPKTTLTRMRFFSSSSSSDEKNIVLLKNGSEITDPALIAIIINLQNLQKKYP